MRKRISKTLVCLALVPLAAGCGPPGPDPAPLPIRVVGEEYEWHVRYPGSDGALDTPDDVLATGDLHIPARSPIEIELDSTDYIYRFQIPELGVNEMAVPDVEFKAQLEAPEVGSHPLLGDQMCGYAHDSLLGEVVVHTSSGFEQWLARQRRFTQ